MGHQHGGDLKKAKKGKIIEVVGVDPGLGGGIVLLGENGLKFWEMPVNDEGVQFGELEKIFNNFLGVHIFLERAIPMAQGAKAAFSSGKYFAYVEIAIKLSRNSVTYVEPHKWPKVMHSGISADLKPKAKSLIALERLYPNYIDQIPRTPKSKKLHDGIVDALLIAGYGQRVLGAEQEDFY